MAAEIKIIDNGDCVIPLNASHVVFKNVPQICFIPIVLIYILVSLALLLNISPFTAVFFLPSCLLVPRHLGGQFTY